MSFYVQSCQGTAHAVTSQTAVFGSNTTATNLIVVDVAYWVSGGVTGGITVNDSQGNAYLSCGAPATGDGGTCQSFYAKNTVGGANTVTVTAGNAGDLNVVATEYSGCNTSSPLDAYIAAASVGAVTSLDSGDLTTTVNGDLLHVNIQNVSLNAVFTLDTGYNLRQTVDNPDDMGSASGDNIAGAAGSYSSTSTSSTTGVLLTAFTAFKPASSGFGTATTAAGQARAVSSVSTGTTLNTKIGDAMLVAVGWSHDDSIGTCTGVVDTAGNTYVPLTQRAGTNGEAFQYFICLGATIANALNTLTASFSYASNNNTIIYVWDVPAGGTVVYDTDTASDGGTDATTAMYSTTGTDEYVVVCAYDQFGTDSYTAQVSPAYTLDSAGFFGSPPTFGGAQHIQFASPQTGITSSFPSHPSQSAAFALAVKTSGAPPATPTQPTICIMN